MTTVYFTQNAAGLLTGFVSIGHADYKKKGPDVVCAGISALTANAANSLEEIAHVPIEVNNDPKEPSIAVRLKHEPNETTEIILRSLELGLKGISKKYGSKYCKVTTKEEVKC